MSLCPQVDEARTKGVTMTATYLAPHNTLPREFAPSTASWERSQESMDDIAERSVWIQLLHEEDGLHLQAFSVNDALISISRPSPTFISDFVLKTSKSANLAEVTAAAAMAGNNVFVYAHDELFREWVYWTY